MSNYEREQLEALGRYSESDDWGTTDMGEYHDPKLRTEKFKKAQEFAQAFGEIALQGDRVPVDPPSIGGMHDHLEYEDGQWYETTPNRRFEITSPIVQEQLRQQRIARIGQSIIAEIANNPNFKPDMDWEVYWRVNELEEHDRLPSGITGHDIFNYYQEYWNGE